MIIICKIIAILGVLSLALGTLLVSGKRKFRRRYTYPLLIFGGACLEIYSIYLKDLIFIILQAVFIASAIYGLIKLHEHKHHKRKI